MANVAVHTVEFGCACNTKAVFTKSAGYDFGPIIEKADPRSGVLTFFVIKVHSDGIAFDWINIDPVPEHCSNLTAANARTHDNAIG